MRSLRQELTWIEKAFDKYDRLYFNSYFSDKKHNAVKVRLNRRLRSCYARAIDDGTIEINPVIFEVWSREEMRDTLLHEMLHLFLRFTHKDKTAWDDKSPVFREWSKRLHCPATACPSEFYLTKRLIFRMCYDCDAFWIPSAGSERTRRCQECGSLNTKLYKRNPKV